MQKGLYAAEILQHDLGTPLFGREGLRLELL